MTHSLANKLVLTIWLLSVYSFMGCFYILMTGQLASPRMKNPNEQVGSYHAFYYLTGEVRCHLFHHILLVTPSSLGSKRDGDKERHGYQEVRLFRVQLSYIGASPKHCR